MESSIAKLNVLYIRIGLKQYGMKVLCFVLGCIMLSVGGASGQGTGFSISAFNYYHDGETGKAKEAIDKALKYEDTREKAKTWQIKGDVYSRIAAEHNETYGITGRDAAIEAVEAYLKALTLDTRRIDKNMLFSKLKYASNLAFSEGVSAYNNSDYSAALRCFSADWNGKEALDETDSLALFNMGLCYENLNQNSEAIRVYQQCVAIGYKPQSCYEFMVLLHRKSGDNRGALSVVTEALQLYPDNFDFVVGKINLLLFFNEMSAALPYLNKAISMQPDDPLLYYSRGTCYSQLGDDLKAIPDFKKALELKPDFFDATYNLGASYFNLGADVVNEASELVDEVAYEKKLEEANVYFVDAQKYLELALELDPYHRTVMQSLLQLYARLGENEKYRDIKARMND